MNTIEYFPEPLVEYWLNLDGNGGHPHRCRGPAIMRPDKTNETRVWSCSEEDSINALKNADPDTILDVIRLGILF